MSDTYVIVHGAWHTGAEMEPTAALGVSSFSVQ